MPPLLICLITYNRLGLSKATLQSLLETVGDDKYIIAVDNDSTDGTQDWLIEQLRNEVIDFLIMNDKNYFPGRACNQGFEVGLRNFNRAEYVMRLDNDMRFYKGWRDEIPKYFKAFPTLAQLGLDWHTIEKAPQEGEFGWRPFGTHGPNFHSDQPRVTKKGVELIVWPGFVGGLMVMPSRLIDAGYRYSERPWYDSGKDFIAPQEDAMLSMNLRRDGYTIGHVNHKVAETVVGLDSWQDDPEYYKPTLARRGYNRIFKEAFDKL